MSYVLTLIANPDKAEISESLINEVKAQLSTDKTDTLADGVAQDFFIDTPVELPKFDGIDTILQSTDNRRKKLLIADMDSTIVTGETLDDLAEFAGLKDEVAAITMRAMNGEIKFRDALRERVLMLKGLSADFMEKAMEMVELTGGAKTLVQTMKANGAYCALVSGGFDFFTSRVANMVGFDFNRGNVMEIQDGLLTGNVIDPIVTKDTKLEELIALSAKLNITTQQGLAVGDGANDLPMITEAGLGIAFHAKPSVVEQATHNIKHNDLTALLYAQGYKKSEFK